MMFAALAAVASLIPPETERRLGIVGPPRGLQK